MAVRSEQKYFRNEFRHLLFHLPQQRIIGAGIGQARRHGSAQAYHQVLEIADMLIDLRREKLRLVERVAQCVRLILPQL